MDWTQTSTGYCSKWNGHVQSYHTTRIKTFERRINKEVSNLWDLWGRIEGRRCSNRFTTEKCAQKNVCSPMNGKSIYCRWCFTAGWAELVDFKGLHFDQFWPIPILFFAPTFPPWFIPLTLLFTALIQIRPSEKHASTQHHAHWYKDTLTGIHFVMSCKLLSFVFCNSIREHWHLVIAARRKARVTWPRPSGPVNQLKDLWQFQRTSTDPTKWTGTPALHGDILQRKMGILECTKQIGDTNQQYNGCLQISGCRCLNGCGVDVRTVPGWCFVEWKRGGGFVPKEIL